jgi:hypothetical protein
LDSEQRARASFAFSDAEQRSDWAYFPRDHAGLPLLKQDALQQKLLHALLTSALSLPAYAKATSIMALESVLNEIEGRSADAVRDPGRYFLSVFGSPADNQWGWRFEGHHVCLNFTILGGDVASSTPIFIGANPAEVRHGDYIVTRPCGEEEDVARELLLAFDDDQRREAVICDVAPPDFVLSNAPLVPEACLAGEATGASPFVTRLFGETPDEVKEAVRFDRATPRGLVAPKMDASQRKLLSALVEVYVSRLPELLADVERAKIDVDVIYFAWAGVVERGGPHYYRLQGGSFLVEYDNTQDNANHVHAVWRDTENDFGGDALRRHLSAEH